MIIGIVAVDQSGAIGKDGQLPWHYSADMKHFKETTLGHACLMGRKTWQTLKRPLPNRLNIIMTRHATIEPQVSVLVLRDEESALKLAREMKGDLFIIGGAEIYRAFLPWIEKWIVTTVPLRVEDADAFVPGNYLEGFVPDGSKQIDEGLTVTTWVRKAILSSH
jgi:dihydrofolate reductase